MNIHLFVLPIILEATVPSQNILRHGDQNKESSPCVISSSFLWFYTIYKWIIKMNIVLRCSDSIKKRPMAYSGGGAHQKHAGRHITSLRIKMGARTHRTITPNTMQLVVSRVMLPRQSLYALFPNILIWLFFYRELDLPINLSTRRIEFI